MMKESVEARVFLGRSTALGRRIALSATIVLLTLNLSSYAQSESIIEPFSCNPAVEVMGGCIPAGGVIDMDGALFGGTIYGGKNTHGIPVAGDGLVFALRPPAAAGGPWSETALYRFNGGADGSHPAGPLLAGSGNTLYGATTNAGDAGYGTIFSLQPQANGGTPWVETTLYSFAGGADATPPQTALIQDANGTLYGASNGGSFSSGCFDGCGAIFALTPPSTPGAPWSESILYSFTGGSDGLGPSSSLVLGQNGVLYGTATNGGASSNGVVYALTPPAIPGGSWTESVLYSFTGFEDGGQPAGTLFQDKHGRLFGTCGNSNGNRSNAFGTVFELSPPSTPGGAWSEQTLWVFGTLPDDGEGPVQGVTLAGGILYGSTIGGAEGTGTVFQLAPPAFLGDPWTEAVLHPFSFNGADGYYTNSGVVSGPNGMLYGTTSSGGPNGGGTVYAVAP